MINYRPASSYEFEMCYAKEKKDDNVKVNEGKWTTYTMATKALKSTTLKT